MTGHGEQTMGADECQRQSQRENQSRSPLPRYVVDHIGQVLRNRYRDSLLIPVPKEMLTLLEATGRSSVQINSTGKPQS